RWCVMKVIEHKELINVLVFITYYSIHATVPTKLNNLSLHDALPISRRARSTAATRPPGPAATAAASLRGRRASSYIPASAPRSRDRKSTRLNSSHVKILYDVFCLTKKSKEKLFIIKYALQLADQTLW